MSKQNKSIGLVTWNILANKWFEWQAKEGIGYDKVEQVQFDWTHRFAQQCAKCQTHIDENVDLFCLQEMQDTVFPQFQAWFAERGFTGIFQESNNNYPVGCAIFWRDNVFKLRDVDHRSRSVLVSLQCGDEVLYVICAHLEGNRRDSYHGAKRLEQLVSALKRLQALVVKDQIGVDQARVIVCGDLNALPTEETYKFLAEGSLPAAYEQSLIDNGNAFVTEAGTSAIVTKKAIAHPFKLASAYRLVHDKEPSYTFVGKTEAYTLDYAFVTNVTVDDAQLGNECVQPAPLGAIPDDARPSDHVEIRCRLTF